MNWWNVRFCKVHRVTARAIQQFSVSVKSGNRVEPIGGQIPANADVRNERPLQIVRTIVTRTSGHDPPIRLFLGRVVPQDLFVSRFWGTRKSLRYAVGSFDMSKSPTTPKRVRIATIGAS